MTYGFRHLLRRLSLLLLPIPLPSLLNLFVRRHMMKRSVKFRTSLVLVLILPFWPTLVLITLPLSYDGSSVPGVRRQTIHQMAALLNTHT
jgi:hypothetical protein